jgi:integrase
LIPGDPTNTETLRKAEEVKANRIKDYAANNYNLSFSSGSKTQVIPWMEKFAKEYTKGDKRNVEGVLRRFKDFLAAKKKSGITFGQMDEDLIIKFRDNLIKNCAYSGSTSYFARFKKMMRAASKKLKFPNPAAEVENLNSDAEKRDTLTLDEVSLLAQTPITNTEIRNAFLYCCFTGMAWVDVANLTWKEIDGAEMKYKRNKTKKDVRVPLNSAALELLGEKGKRDSRVFTLPTADGANKSLQAWVDRAGIDKKITWHCARHTCGTILGKKGKQVHVIGSFLGHVRGSKSTFIYIDTDEESKRAAADSMNIKV